MKIAKPMWKRSTRKCPRCRNRKTEKEIGRQYSYRCPSCGQHFS